MHANKTQKKVLVTGVFDLLHAEHTNFLNNAASLGELYVGIESDVRVRNIKGEGRPINDEQLRKKNLEKLKIAKEVFVLPEAFDKPEHHRQLLEKIKPDILAVSSHSPHLDKKASLMKDIGGTLKVVLDHNPSISTTILLNSKKASNGQT